jgi:putative exosortase-associated protein (TIGR04073 family)
MMTHKKSLMILALFVTVLMSMTNVQAANVSTLSHADPYTSKFGRGISNFLFGFFEIPQTMLNVEHQSGPFAGITVGFLKGFRNFICREFVGLYEMMTFFYPQDPFIIPEFPFSYEDEHGAWGF